MKDLNSIYRPVKWSDVKGQDRIVRVLQNQIKTGKGLSNAYILAGGSGIGKTTLARLFFLSLNCQKPDKEFNPCMKCSSCTNFQFELKEVNASNTRGIDDMREIVRDMQYTAMSNYKGVILDEVHMLLKPAWNCLLKPIEDASKSIWFFCTTELYKIPKTIQTRCQIYKLGQIRWTDIHARLKAISEKSKIKISNEDLWIIARNSANNLRQAVHLLEQYMAVGDMKEILSEEADMSFLEALRDNNTGAIWSILAKWDTKHANIDAFLNAIKYDLSVCLEIKLGLDMSKIAPFKLAKYKQITISLPEELLFVTLQEVLAIQEKISGVWDYKSLFLSMLYKIKTT